MTLLVPAGLLATCQASRPKKPGPVPGTDVRDAMAAGPSASIDIHTIEASFIGGVARGSGTLAFQGRSHPFRVGGLGVGGIGVSRGSAMVVDREVLGSLWLKNRAGTMHLRPREEGPGAQRRRRPAANSVHMTEPRIGSRPIPYPPPRRHA